MVAAVYKTEATLRILGDELDPDEITRLLGKRPYRAERKGEIVLSSSGNSRIARIGTWSISAKPQAPEDLNAQITEILDGATEDINTWRRITERFKADVFCGLFMNQGNEGLELSPSVLHALGARGIRLSLDIYAGPSDDPYIRVRT